MTLSPPPLLPAALPRDALLAIVRAVLVYTVFAVLWILLSDRAVTLLFDDAGAQAIASTLKGLVFVAATSLLLFFFLLRFATRHPAKVSDGGAPAPSSRRLLFGSVATLALVSLLFGLGGTMQHWERHRETAAEQLQAIAKLKAAQIENWLGERLGDTELLRTTPGLADALARWRGGDGSWRTPLRDRLEAHRSLLRYDAMAICDADGDILLQAGADGHGSGEPLRAAVRRALSSGHTTMTGVYGMAEPPPPHMHLDVVGPIPGTNAVVVLRTDLNATLYAFLQTWPLRSASGETLLVRREGDQALFLNDLRHRPGATLQLRLPLATPGLVAAQALAAGYRPGRRIEGVDYRGVRVIGVAQPVAGTDWWVVAKMDRDEVFDAASGEILWIAFCSLLTWAVATVLAALLVQRRELQHAQTQRREQAERLRALQLLDAIAAGSNDVIFAQDLAGRFTFFNRAAEQLTGKPAAEALGRDEAFLFPPETAEVLIERNRRVLAEGKVIHFEDAIPTADGQRIFLTTKGPLRDAAGQVIGLFGTARDISERTRMEAELKQAKDRLRALVNTIPDLVWLKDANGRYLACNPRFEQFFGAREAEIVGKTDYDFVPRDQADFFRANDRAAMERDGPTENEEEVVFASDGHREILQTIKTPFRDGDGRLVGVLGIGRNIASLKAAEAELKTRNEELERFNRAMVGRELEMIGLKRQINALSLELGRAPPFDLPAVDGAAAP